MKVHYLIQSISFHSRLQNFPRANKINDDMVPDANGFNPIRVPDEFAQYFEGTGAVDWQWRRVLINDF